MHEKSLDSKWEKEGEILKNVENCLFELILYQQNVIIQEICIEKEFTHKTCVFFTSHKE